ncbi:DUF805 domain-containing protein [Pseudomonas sp. NPDC007930]|uniref:DUF805 domain-containing protein n=1 Tax=Pseudomonas sp. NPDC007930 TaxID=3364417 RepID=UPI0036E7953A
MHASSPFEPPKANLETTPAFADLDWKTHKGRLGRVRYLAWSLVLMAAMVPAILVLVSVAGAAPMIAAILAALLAIFAIIIGLRFYVRRIHDIGWSAWWLLLLIVPLVGYIFPFVLMLMPGTAGVNRFGPPTPPNTTTVKVLAALSVVAYVAIMVFGFLSGFSSALHR